MNQTTTIKSFRDLVARQLPDSLGLAVNKLLPTFPPDERFGLALQLRRAAFSIAAGFGRGSLEELQTQIRLSLDLGYLTTEARTRLDEQVDETERVLWGLIRAIERRAPELD